MQKLAVKAGKLVTGTGDVREHAVLYCEDGVIKEIVSDGDRTYDCPTVDASDAFVYPGFIDAFSHVGLNKEPYRFGEPLDGVETSSPFSPDLNARDSFNPFAPGLDAVRSAGITTCYAAVGPATLISGQGVSFKLRKTQNAEEMFISDSEQMHFSVRWLNLWSFSPQPQPPVTRMGVLHKLRGELDKAKEIAEKGEAPLSPLAKVVSGKMKARFYCMEAQDIASSIKLAESYGLDYAIDGAFEAWKIPDILKEYHCPVVLTAYPFSPVQNAWREMIDYSQYTAAVVEGSGCPLALTADSVANTKMLPYLAGFSISRGLSPEKALAAITLEAAKVLGIDHRVGSLEVGKDADFCIYSGDGLLSTSRCLKTFVDGQLVYQAEM